VSLIDRSDDAVISFIGLQRQLLLWSQASFLHLLDLFGKDCFSWRRTIDTACLDTDNGSTSIFEEMRCVQNDDTSLIGLRNISKNRVYHSDQHSVFLRVSSILDDRDDIGSLFGHVDEISSTSMTEFNCINSAFWSDYISYVADTCSTGRSKIKHFLAWFDMNVVHTS
jgi:hypothetical protein